MSQWRIMPGGHHLVSDDGRVQTVKTGRILKTTTASNGYATFGSYAERGKRRNFFVHHLVAELFIGPRDGLNVNHKDGNKLNNHLENLELVTPRENSEHASRMGLMATGTRHGSKTHPERVIRGEDHAAARLSTEQVVRARELVTSGHSCRSIAKEWGISESAVRRAVRGIDWRHVPSPTSQRFVGIGSKNGFAKLTEELVLRIRREYETGQFSQNELAARYHVSQSTISNVTRHRDAWEHVA